MRSYNTDTEAITGFTEIYRELKEEIGKVIVGQDEIIKRVLITIFSRGHVLLIGVPGLAKTLMVTTIAKALGLSFNRIQFTPDIMPSDIIGTEILDENRQFRFAKGPVFAHVILADEINRTPPKTQSALLEAMQERSVSTAGTTHILPNPFFVLATQNPIEQEGTYPLPEAQLDRFMFNLYLDYPSVEEEINIVKSTICGDLYEPKKILETEDIIYFQQLLWRVPVADNVYQYAVKLSTITRPNTPLAHEWANKYMAWGAGPRCSQNLIIAAKCHAVLSGKLSPDIENIKAIAHSVMRHRIVRNYRAEAENVSVDDIIDKLLHAN
ncbi:MAG: AAA family ATPase [Bacteroidales bacterium]|jgi:MoxR-like ATPase|nr:AAA family ATPase [Bacteroidales bacterium]